MQRRYSSDFLTEEEIAILHHHLTSMFFRPQIDLTPQEFKSTLNETNGIVIDCRTKEECASGTWPGAVQLDWLSGEFHDQVGQLDKSKSYFLYCHAGSRSAQATAFLKSQGIQNAYNVGAYASISSVS